MTELELIVSLAQTGPLGFVTVVLVSILTGLTIYFTYRALRDLEVFLLERQRLKEEVLEREEETTWNSSNQ